MGLTAYQRSLAIATSATYSKPFTFIKKRKMTKVYYISILFAIILSCNPISNQKDIALAKEKTAPFSKIDFREFKIFVTLDEKEYQWLKLDTLEVADIVNQFKENFDDKWEKRFSEDIVEYLNKLNVYPKHKESFTLKGEEGEVKSIVLTFDKIKRKQAKQHFESTYEKEIDINVILSRQEAIDDINQLQILLQNKYSYVFLKDVNVNEEIQLLKEGLEGQVTTYDLALRIGKLLNKFGDGHSRIHNVNFKENGVLPFSVSSFNHKVICTKDGKLLSDDYPFLHSINGIEVSKLLETSEEYLTPDASPQFKEKVKVSRLSRIGEILKLNGSTDNKLNVELESDDGKTTSFMQDMDEYTSRKDLSPIQKAKMFKERNNYEPFEVKHFDNIGYLRIKSMEALRGDDSNELPINELENSEGLILDVRDNGGGLRDILIELSPHLINKKQGFVVGNVARLRTDDTSKNHDLSDRYLYQIGDEHFDEDVKLKLKSWSSNFSQSVSLSDSLYSPYYYLYIEGHQNPKFIHTPTVVLMNEGCYSATDIFLSAFKEIDGVTLIGTASGGGSGRSRRYQLNNSLIEIRLSSIVSFQPNGELYDGIGVHPDIVVKQLGISDILKETDNQLEFALKFLRGKLNNR